MSMIGNINSEIYTLRYEAKRQKGLNDAGLAQYLGVSTSTIRNRASKDELWRFNALELAIMAKMAKKKWVLVDDDN